MYVFRFATLCLLHPLLDRVGYGLSWQNNIVVSWSGLRGAVSMALALVLSGHTVLAHDENIGPKVNIKYNKILLIYTPQF